MKKIRARTLQELNEHAEILKSLLEAPDVDLTAAERIELNEEVDRLLYKLARL